MTQPTDWRAAFEERQAARRALQASDAPCKCRHPKDRHVVLGGIYCQCQWSYGRGEGTCACGTYRPNPEPSVASAGQAPATDQTADDVRDQVLHALDFAYCQGIGYSTPEELLAAYDASRAPAGQAEAVLRVVEMALGDTLVASARDEALAGIAAVLHASAPADQAAEVERLRLQNERMRHELEVMYGGAFDSPDRSRPADRAAVLRDAAERLSVKAYKLTEGLHDLAHFVAKDRLREAEILDREATVLRRVADETQPTAPHSCGNCEGIDPDTCFNNPDRPPEQCPAAEFEDYGQQCQKPVGHELHTFEEQPVAGARQDEPRPSIPPCVHCTHPKSDHDGRADHRAKHSLLVAGEPWCHACNAPCDYAGARQDGADHVCNSVMARGEMDEPLGYLICGMCGKPKSGARQDGAQS